MPRIITTPAPLPETDPQKMDTATEEAFNALMDAAIRLGLPINRPMGLMYLSTAELTRNFQIACRATIASVERKS